MSARGWLIIGAGLVCVAGCHKVFGDFEVNDSAFGGKGGSGSSAGSSSGAQSGSSVIPMDGACDDGERQCIGPVLQSPRAATA